MLWADSIAENAKGRFAKKISEGKPLIIRDEKTSSGRVHVGSLRGVAIHGLVGEALIELDIPNTFLFEINDFDPMDGLPVYLDQEKFRKHMGKPLCKVPSPDEKSLNYAEYFADEFIDVIKEVGFSPNFYRASEMYSSGRFNKAIEQALKKASVIRDIYKKISGTERPDSWLPISVICENCGKIGTTKATDFDGMTVRYECGNFAAWATGCGSSGRVSPFDGKAKLPWKVEWAAKFAVLDVDIGGGGKDHSTRGGAREVADAISREVYDREPPLNIPYEFFLVGGKKMSSSKGEGSSAREVASLLPPHMVRFLMAYKEPTKVIDFVPDGDTIPTLFDAFDKYAASFFAGTADDYARTIDISLPSDSAFRGKHLLPRFSLVSYLTQMPHKNIEKEIASFYETKLNLVDIQELNLREKYAKYWLSTWAPEDYKFEIQDKLPEEALLFNEMQKKTLGDLSEYFQTHNNLSGPVIHAKLHDFKSASHLSPTDFFSMIYISILGKSHGPKAGWFLSVLDRDFLIRRFKEASQQ